MKHKVIITFLIALFSNYWGIGQTSFGRAENIDSGWFFRLEDVEEGESVNLNDSRWQRIDLPHDWSVKGQLSPTLASATGYLPGGIGWYRKHLNIPQNKKGEKVYLYFEGVYNRSEVFINGVSLGKRPNGYISFMYDATPYIKFGEDNIIAVRVDHSKSVDSRWYTGSGIYRDAWVVYSNPVHISEWGVQVYPKKLKKGYELNIGVSLENETAKLSLLTVTNELYDSNQKLVAKSSEKVSVKDNGSGKISTLLKVNSPKLWSLESPNLYTLKTTVISNGSIIDATNTITGFRDFTFNPDKGFALNGEGMKIKGVCLHHDGGVLGSAVPKEVWRRRLLNLKEIGVNAIRTSHNPQSPDLYNLCDELGLLVLNEAFDEWEFAKRKWIEGWNVGTPGFQGSNDFFDEWGERDLADMVKRDRNHISIFAWSIGNEVDYPNDPYSHPVLDGGKNTGFTQPIFGGYKKDAPDAMRLGEIAKRLVKVVKENDTSRPVTAGLAGVAMSNQTEYPFALDITGYNYTESLYDQNHKTYPERIIFGSENRHDFAAWKDVTSRDFIFGQFIWTGIDYLGESGSWPSRGFYSGLLDFGGFIKPRGYFRQSLWSKKPMAYIGTYPTPGKGSINQAKDAWSQLDAKNENGAYEEKTPSMDAWPIWNYHENQLIRVVCYTNAAKAKLLLNNTVIGETKDYDTTTGIIYWDIPYHDGKLEVIGMDSNDNPISQYTIQTSERPHSINIISPEELTYTKGDIAQIVIQLEDENGIPVMISDDEITCDTIGAGTLLGLEASNNEDMSDYTDNKQRVYHGRLIAYIKIENNHENIKVRFTAPWLKPDEIEINVK